MTADARELLAKLQALGIEMALSGDRLRWRPRDAVPLALRQLIVQHKAALIALLTGSNGPISETASTAAIVDPDPGNSRPVWILHANGYPERVFTLDRIPPEATYWCHEGDKQWQPIQREAE
jgi:hypothetical protein